MTIKFTKTVVATIFITSTFMILNSAYAGGRLKAKGVKTNPNGSITSVRVGAAKGKNGGGFVNARGTTTNGQGQVAGGGSTVVKGSNSGGGIRVGAFTADDSGNVNYQGGAVGSGSNGSVATSGGFTRSENGEILGSRSTTATNNYGNTYDGNTTYQTSSGIVHTQTCYNSIGDQIKCPNNQ